jgi:hypothetical protein
MGLLLHLAREVRPLQPFFDDQITLMHVGRSPVPFCWVGRDAPHQAVIYLPVTCMLYPNARCESAQDVHYYRLPSCQHSILSARLVRE